MGVYPGSAPANGTLAKPPDFTLFGDRSVVYVDASASDDRHFVLRRAELRTEQVDDLLELALYTARLGDARDRYDWADTFDVPVTNFEIHAGGVDKSVWVSGLEGNDGSSQHVVDADMRDAFRKLEAVLSGFAEAVRQGEYQEAGLFLPQWYEAQLSKPTYPRNAHAWPWPELGPAEFERLPDGTLSKIVTAKDANTVLHQWSSGYFQAVAPDGVTYVFVLRSLLPDEAP